MKRKRKSCSIQINDPSYIDECLSEPLGRLRLLEVPVLNGPAQKIYGKSQ